MFKRVQLDLFSVVSALLGFVPFQLALANPPAAAAKAEKKPNIVYFLVDNLGFGELGCYGGGILRGARTPRIDNFAHQGTRLLNFAPESQCTPSREREPYDYPYLHTWTIAHTGKILRELEQSVQREALIPAGATLNYVPK